MFIFQVKRAEWKSILCYPEVVSLSSSPFPVKRRFPVETCPKSIDQQVVRSIPIMMAMQNRSLRCFIFVCMSMFPSILTLDKPEEISDRKYLQTLLLSPTSISSSETCLNPSDFQDSVKKLCRC